MRGSTASSSPREYSPGPRDWQPRPQLLAGVRSLAYRWSRDHPDVQADLEQEALLAIWLKGYTDAPLAYQLRTARNRMLSVRKLGKSVDGKLDATYHRTRQYVVVSTERETRVEGGELLPLRDLLPSAFLVEPYIVSKLTMLEMLSVLAAEERLCVVLILRGFTLREVVKHTRADPASVMRILGSARQKLSRFSTPPASRT